MHIIEDVRTFTGDLPGLVLTIGSFDGVHLGHQRILELLVRDAQARGGTAALMTLRPHPRQFFSPASAPNILTSDVQKEELIAAAGVDVLFVLPFNAAVANLDRREFIERIVVGNCRARKLIVGHDFNFGRGAQGNYEYLCEIAPELGLEVEQVPALVLEGERVSSTLIRELVMQGEMDRVAHFLGRGYAIRGQVIKGRGMGVKLGWPTANVDPHNTAVPMHGIYVCEAVIDGAAHPAAVNIGIAPTIRHDSVMIEAHVLDFSEDLVGREIDIVFHKRLRPEKKFHSLTELSEAIARDVDDVRAWFANNR